MRSGDGVDTLQPHLCAKVTMLRNHLNGASATQLSIIDRDLKNVFRVRCVECSETHDTYLYPAEQSFENRQAVLFTIAISVNMIGVVTADIRADRTSDAAIGACNASNWRAIR